MARPTGRFHIGFHHAAQHLNARRQAKLLKAFTDILKGLVQGLFDRGIAAVVSLVMALLSFRGISTPSLQAQGEQRRHPIFNIRRDIPVGEVAGGVRFMLR